MSPWSSHGQNVDQSSGVAVADRPGTTVVSPDRQQNQGRLRMRAQEGGEAGGEGVVVDGGVAGAGEDGATTPGGGKMTQVRVQMLDDSITLFQVQVR